MKKIKSLLLIGIAFAVFACNDFLDVNENPNEATSSTPQAILPNALTVTAANIVTYNDYGSWHVGYIANAGGYGGWGSTVTYNYTTNSYANLWTIAYDNLNDYNYIENASRAKTMANFNAVAKIMKAFDFQLLVDTYGDVPYSEALQGVGKLTPKYDKGEDVYKNLLVTLDSAILLIDKAPSDAVALGATDILFKGTMASWRAFANTLKLRVLIRASKAPGTATPDWVTTGFASFGADPVFLASDAIVNPGYTATSGKQNPTWETYHSNAAGTVAGSGRSRIPTDFILSFYDGKIFDDFRSYLVYRAYPAVPTNQLGFEDPDVPEAPSGAPAWYTGTGTGTDASTTTGIIKGRAMGQPILLAAESYFLQAEAITRGFIPAGTGGIDDATAFTDGIVASFSYLYKNVSNVVDHDPTSEVDAYINNDNPGNPLVDYSAAISEDEKVEAIITQKYIALNFIHGHESWNEFRRTGYPSISGSDSESTFASVVSTSTRGDKLPARILYPASEYQVNAGNAPQNISVFNSLIFWDVE